MLTQEDFTRQLKKIMGGLHPVSRWLYYFGYVFAVLSVFAGALKLFQLLRVS